MYFEGSDKTLDDIYRCRACNKIYHRQLGPTYISCAVAHGPGSCCHYAEKEITEAQVTEIRGYLFGNGILPNTKDTSGGSISIGNPDGYDPGTGL